MTDRLTRSDPIFLRINLLFLMVVTFLPFPTRLVTDALHERDAERVAVTIYGLTLLAIRVLLIALNRYARRERLYSVQTEGEELRAVQRKSFLAVICYVLAILLGLLLPRLAVALYFGLAVYIVCRPDTWWHDSDPNPQGQRNRQLEPDTIRPLIGYLADGTS